jgi:hypothetical protein
VPTTVDAQPEPEKAPWQLVFRQTAGTYLNINMWKSWNIEKPDGDNYSVLNRLEDMRNQDGAFEFKIVWPAKVGDN